MRNTSIGDGWTATATEMARKAKTIDYKVDETKQQISSKDK
jgi:hypothetical protein